MRLAALFILGLGWSVCGFGQFPQIAIGGVVNAASWSSPVAPGSLISIFGSNLAASEQSASPPLALTLGGTSVTINGINAPLAVVSPTQINAQVPSSLPATNLATSQSLGSATVMVTTAAGSSGPVTIGITAGAPGFFSADGSGCGQAAALNTKLDGTVSVNTYSSSAAPGDYISLYGTGFGVAGQQPPDGTAASGASQLQTEPGIFLDSNAILSPLYAGLAPGLVGVDQINFQVPASTRNGCSVPVSASQGLGSPSVTISVQSGRGQCTDPPIQSWGQVLLSKSVFSGQTQPPVSALENFSASFPSGPALQPPAPEQIVYAPNWAGNVLGGAGIIFSPVLINPRQCPVPGYSNLSAGAITIQPPSGSSITAQPLPLLTGGVTYVLALPTGFVVPGKYTLTGAPDSPIELAANLMVGSPIQIQTPLSPGTVISSSQPLTIKWTGGDPGSLVKVILTSGQGSTATSDYSYAEAGSGSLTMNPLCTGNPVSAGGNGIFCSFGIPLSSNAGITVEVLPNPASAPTVSLPGVTGPVQLTWQYSYSFVGLSLGE